MENQKIIGLNFKAKEGFKIKIPSVEMEIPSIYCRTRWGRSIDGKSIEIQCNIYLSKEKFKKEVEDQTIQSGENTIAVRVTSEKGELAKLPGSANYGVHRLPENYDNNDLAFTHAFIIKEFEKFLEIIQP